MFVSCIVVGAVIISKPFTLTRRPFMRDLIFYLAACYWTFFLLWNNSINIWMSVGLCRIVVTWIDSLFNIIVISHRFHYYVSVLCCCCHIWKNSLPKMEKKAFLSKNRRYTKLVETYLPSPVTTHHQLPHITSYHASPVTTHHQSPHITSHHTSSVTTHHQLPHITGHHTSPVTTHHQSPHITSHHTSSVTTHHQSPHITSHHTSPVTTQCCFIILFCRTTSKTNR